jgi:uncharacterized membrane protein (UPF0127 family)
MYRWLVPSLILLVLLGLLLVGLPYIAQQLNPPEPMPRLSNVSAPADAPIPVDSSNDSAAMVEVTEDSRDDSSIRALYEPLIPFTFGTLPMYASIARTEAARTRGLSGTPSLPTDIAKVFVFESSSKYGFWMKDMNYPIDIIWVDETGEVVHVESNLAPETYPKSFAPGRPARVVIEVVAGGAVAAGIEEGSRIDINSFIANQ